MGMRTRRHGLGSGATVVALAAAMILLVSAPAFAFKLGRFTGGGRVNLANDTKTTHGFQLYCTNIGGGRSLEIDPNNLQVNWDTGNHWHLEDLVRGACHNEQWDPEQPKANFDAYYGDGYGRLNGVSGAYACWRLTDDGEPGRDDIFSFRVWAPGEAPNPANAANDPGKCPRPDATPVHRFNNLRLEVGNHQAHMLTGKKAERAAGR
jgi:hypothetical protein